MIEIDALTKNYDQKMVLQNINCVIPASQITAILGPNGCGKSTLIKMLMGLVLPQMGSIKISGTQVLGQQQYKEKIGYLSQVLYFPENLKVREIFKMIKELRRAPAPLELELIEAFEMVPFLNTYFSHLSGGSKQKVGLICALMFDPEILILDEPTVGLDPIANFVLKQILRNFNNKKTVLLVSHMMSEVDQLASQLIFMLDGQIIWQGPCQNLKREFATEQLEQAVFSLLKSKKRAIP